MIGHVTCDNAANNMTMLDEFADCHKLKTGLDYDVKKHHMRCFAHIINLVTQAFISTSSRAKYYTSSDVIDNNKIPEGANCDELGVVRTIIVKVHSSAQRKQLFKEFQEKDNQKPLQLLLDMKVRWGSTFAMIICVYLLREYVDKFVNLIRDKETNVVKKKKLTALALRYEEWEHVRLLANLLQYTDDAQHSFSAGTQSTLHNTLPALEQLYSNWELASKSEVYESFHPALEAGMAKINEYYVCTAESDAHLIAMVLVPNEKLMHFKKNWDAATQTNVTDVLKQVFRERYALLAQNQLSTSNKESMRGFSSKSRSCWVNTDDSHSSESWCEEWDSYLASKESLPEGMTIVHWWGLNTARYPTWASLARDYLSVMASSVSSDIVEALQCLKSLEHCSIIFCEIEDIDAVEKEMEHSEDLHEMETSKSTVLQVKKFSWDQLITDDSDDDDDGNVADVEVD